MAYSFDNPGGAIDLELLKAQVVQKTEGALKFFKQNYIKALPLCEHTLYGPYDL